MTSFVHSDPDLLLHRGVCPDKRNGDGLTLRQKEREGEGERGREREREGE